MAAVTVGSCTLRCCTQVLRKDMGGGGQAEATRQTCRQMGECGCSFPTVLSRSEQMRCSPQIGHGSAGSGGLHMAQARCSDLHCIAGIRVASSAVHKALLYVKAAHQSKSLPVMANH